MKACKRTQEIDKINERKREIGIVRGLFLLY